MKFIGKLLQVAALIILPLSMFLQLGGALTREFGVSDMVKMLICGIALFYVGRLLEGYATKSS